MDIKYSKAQKFQEYLKFHRLNLLKPYRLYHLLPLRPLLHKNLNYNFQQPEMQSSTWNVGPNRNFDLHLKPELTSLPSTMQSHANSRRLTPPRSYLSLTFSRSKLQHLRFKSSTPILSSSSKTLTFRSTPWIPDWKHWNPRLTAKHSFFEDYQLQNLQLTTSNGTSFYIVHEEQGPIVALRLSIIIQQLFHHYQVDTGLTTDVHRCNNLIVQKPCPLRPPPPFHQEREEVLPAYPKFFIWVDQYPPVRIHSGWAYQLHQQNISLPGHLSWHGPLHQQWADAL